ncbi:gasdermin-D [Lemur catta]|uniref:gasdermin-D n=1 Tax=Lemur catta TaxID=9447 RepID=UPI001E269E2D|nr:gasdermin-D [Lemur catta]XP_045417293.1 gasdermin-D [Lemur catta]XP_045417295.1 gasdermin-D [Lemur catta]
MVSAFERVVRSVVRELDCKGELIPVDSLQSAAGFRPYGLVSRKPSSSWFWRPRYKCVNLSIKDILQPDAPEPDLERSGPFLFYDAMDGQLQGSVNLAVPGQGRISGGASVSDSSSASMNVCALRVDPNIWEAMHQQRRLRQPEHRVLQQLRSRGNDVYVVTEVLQTQKEVEVTRTHEREGSGQFALPTVMCFQGEGQGHLSQKKMVTIPSGTILAFRVCQLIIGSDWDIDLFPDKKQRTFLPSRHGHGFSKRTHSEQQPSFGISSIESISYRLKFLADGPFEKQVVTEDFQGLQAEVGARSMELEHMEPGLSRQLLGALVAVLRNKPALQALEDSLEQGLCCGRAEPLDGPAGAILECLLLPSGMLVQELANSIFYLLGALTVLSETQHVLLAEALETGALPGQLKLVGSLLEQAPWQGCSTVSLPPGMLRSSWHEGAPAWVLMEECGLELQVDAPHVHWEPQAQGPTCALYASMVLLSGLNQEAR